MNETAFFSVTRWARIDCLFSGNALADNRWYFEKKNVYSPVMDSSSLLISIQCLFFVLCNRVYKIVYFNNLSDITLSLS